MIRLVLVALLGLSLGALSAGLEDFANHYPNLDLAKFTVGFTQFMNHEDVPSLMHFRSPSESDHNADRIRLRMKELEEAEAHKRATNLKLFLLDRVGVEEEKLEQLQKRAEEVFLPAFLQKFAKTDGKGKGAGLHDFSYRYRSLLLAVNAIHVFAHNSNPRARSVLKINHLSAFDPTELKNFKGFIPSNKPSAAKPNVTMAQTLANAVAPLSIDWTEFGAVGPILNQGSCGCCWTFAAAAVMESRLFISGNGNLTGLSEQEFTSCIAQNGCAGGTYEDAWQYARANGVTASAVYPYVNGNSDTAASCDSNAVGLSVAYTSGMARMSSTYVMLSEDDIMQAVGTTGPVAIGIATPSCFTSYSSGILTSEECVCYASGESFDSVVNQIDHAVTVVGYGTTEDGVQYWKIKNSWGTNWGMGGYILMERNAPVFQGMCGILIQPDYPLKVTLSKSCQQSDPPSYCDDAIVTSRYTNVNTTTGADLQECVLNPAGAFTDSSCEDSSAWFIPGWGWVLIAIAIVIALFLLLCITMSLCRRCKKTSNEGTKKDMPPPPQTGGTNLAGV